MFLTEVETVAEEFSESVETTELYIDEMERYTDDIEYKFH